VEPAFWGELGDLKLRIMKLEKGPIPFVAAYRASNHAQIPGVLTLSPSFLQKSLPLSSQHDPGGTGRSFVQTSCLIQGEVFCMNTIEDLQKFDLYDLATSMGRLIWKDVQTLKSLDHPWALQRMFALVYCDLKHYRFHYRFLFPTLLPPTPYKLVGKPVSLQSHLNMDAKGVDLVKDSLQEFCDTHQDFAFFLLKMNIKREDGCTAPLEDVAELPPTCLPIDPEGLQLALTSKAFLVVVDPSNCSRSPGAPLQNILLLMSLLCSRTAGDMTIVKSLTKLDIICLRSRRGRCDPAASMVFKIEIPKLPENFEPQIVSISDAASFTQGSSDFRVADLSSTMDPYKLATSAVDLNLQLMKWRAAPDLDVSKVSQSRFLLLGAGTLGCSVARTLLGWGVRKITFVDNARVSYSNPVRQSLYTFEDCLDGGKPKAMAAAEALHRIFPDVDAGYDELTIPMPGHPPSTSEIDERLDSAARLHDLIASHDVIMLLLDTREARWLPTVMASAAGKLAVTAALGFDSFMVMRHGSSSVRSNVVESKRLGCYFCYDIVAPTNSLRDRALDQQCTVARPGLSSIAGALAVEIAAATLTHPLGVDAPPACSGGEGVGEGTDKTDEVKEGNGPLGPIPHMIRGQLTGFSQMTLTGHAFPLCPACSSVVVEEYNTARSDFILRVLQESNYLEELTGLKELHEEAEAVIRKEQLKTDNKRRGGEEGDEGWLEL
jgi:ubiquitin-like modifier-activating enzyme ATG7